MGNHERVCIILCLCLLLVLIPPVFADGSSDQVSTSEILRKLRQERHHAVFTADESIAEGDRAKQGGDYIEALGNYNMAIDQIQNSRLSQPDKNKKLAEIYRHKAELYRVRQDLGDDALATRADEQAASYIEQGTYSGPSSCFTLLVYDGTALGSTVQQVRDFRDNSVRKSYTGSRFMDGFTAWYYSFSPSAAGFIGRHPMARTLLAFHQAPLLGIVLVSQGMFDLVSFNYEFAAVCALITGGLLYGLVYIFPIAALVMIFARGRGGIIPPIWYLKPAAVIWVCSILAVVTGIILSLDMLTTVSSGALVLCSIILSAGFSAIGYCRFMTGSMDRDPCPSPERVKRQISRVVSE